MARSEKIEVPMTWFVGRRKIFSELCSIKTVVGMDDNRFNGEVRPPGWNCWGKETRWERPMSGQRETVRIPTDTDHHDFNS